MSFLSRAVKKFEFDRRAPDSSRPPIRYGKMVGIDGVMTEQVLAFNQGT